MRLTDEEVQELLAKARLRIPAGHVAAIHVGFFYFNITSRPAWQELAAPNGTVTQDGDRWWTKTGEVIRRYE